MLKKTCFMFCPVELLDCNIAGQNDKDGYIATIFNLSDEAVRSISLSVKQTGNSGRKQVFKFDFDNLGIKEADKGELRLNLPSDTEDISIVFNKVVFESGRVWTAFKEAFKVYARLAFTWTVVLAFAAAIFYTAFYQALPRINLSRGVKLINNGDYENAVQIFKRYINYGNTKNYIKALQGNNVKVANTLFYLDKSGDLGIYGLDIQSGSVRKIVSDVCSDFDVLNNTIFYVSAYDGGTIYSVDTNGGNKVKLSPQNSIFVTADSDNCYYYRPADGRLYYTSLNGKKGGVMREGRFICSDDNFIYYTRPKINDGIYKVSRDGMQRSKVTKTPSTWLSVSDDFIYFVNIVQTNNIYRVSTDGQKEEILCDHDASNAIVYGNWVYYINNGNNGHIYRVKIDGSEIQSLCSDQAAEIAVGDNRIFYVNVSDGKKIYSINISGEGSKGENKLKINDDNSYNIMLDGEWISYTNASQNDKPYKIKTNGKERTEVK